MTAPPKPKPIVRVRPHSYQPSRAELEEDVRVDSTPDDLALAVLQPVRIVKDDGA